jgi:hypothetical protein
LEKRSGRLCGGTVRVRIGSGSFILENPFILDSTFIHSRNAVEGIISKPYKQIVPLPKREDTLNKFSQPFHQKRKKSLIPSALGVEQQLARTRRNVVVVVVGEGIRAQQKARGIKRVSA